MKLYVLRHGLSLTITEAKVAHDADRPLADLGRQDIQAQVSELKKKGGTVDEILCSPLKRAQETAAEAAAILKPKAGVRVFQPLANEIPGQDLFIAVQAEAKNALMIVGHQPQLGEMVGHLVGHSVDIRPGGLVALDVNGSKAKLLWSKNP